jgi:hypothetical protein
MDPLVASDLRRLGVGFSEGELRPAVAIAVDPERQLIALEDDVVPIGLGGRAIPARLGSIASLFKGDRRPPRFDHGPTPDYALFFETIEGTFASCVPYLLPRPTDQEVERLYRRLRRHHDGSTNDAPVLTYLRAAVRLYMSLADVSRAEFDAVLNEVARSVRSHASGHASWGYVTLLEDLFEEDETRLLRG